MDQFKEILLVPLFKNEVRALFLGEGAKFVAGVFGSDGFVEFALHGKVEPFLRAGFELKAHARSDAQRADKADGLVRKAMNDEGADFAVFDVRQAVGGIEEKAARSRI